MRTEAPTTSPARLWAAYHRTRGDDDRNALAAHYLPAVVRSAELFHKRLPREVQLDDLIQWGSLGLMDALTVYDPGRRVGFRTFAGMRIRGAMLDGLRAASVQTRNTLDRTRQLSSTEDALSAELGRAPTPEETTAKLGWSDGKYRSAVSLRHIHPKSLDAVMVRDGRPTPMGDLIEDPRAPDPSTQAVVSDLMEYAVRHFRLTEAFILRLYYFESMTMRQVAEVLDLTECRISQLHSGVLAKLRGVCAAA